MNIQISEYQINVVNEMIAFQCLSMTAEDAVIEMINDDINGIERTLNELKELKKKQQQLIKRPKFYIVK